MRDQISVSFGTGEVTGVFVEDIVCVDQLHEDEASKFGLTRSDPLQANATTTCNAQEPHGCPMDEKEEAKHECGPSVEDRNAESTRN